MPLTVATLIGLYLLNKECMKLDENYRLENDSNQWVLIYEKRGEINLKTGKPKTSLDKWYCSTLQNALKRYINEVLKPSNMVLKVSIQLDELNKKIENLEL